MLCTTRFDPGRTGCLPRSLRGLGRLLPLALVLLTGPAWAAVITVTTPFDENNAFAPNGSCALREAIEAANSDSAVDACAAGSGADVIEVPAGTYLLSLAGAGEDLNQTGDLDVTDDVEIVGAGPDETVIDQGAAGPARAVHIQCDTAAPSAIHVTLRGLRVTGGGIEGPGGGVLIQDCASPVDATLEDVQVDGNTSGYESSPAGSRPGAGVAIDTAGQVTIRDSSIAENTFAVLGLDLGSICGAGVGITGGGSTLIEDSRIRDNECIAAMTLGSLPSGAGVWTDATTTIRGTTFDGNRAAYARGGGVYCESALLKIENSTFSGNEAVLGGAFGNGVGGAPGCITQLDSVTVAGNVGQGGGLSNETGTVVVTNSIVAGNELGGSPDDVRGHFDSGDHNLVGSADGSTGFVGPNDLTGTAASPLDPLIAGLGSGGFAVPTRPPQPGSPALDSGGSTALSVDQRGLPRGALGFAPERGAAEVIGANFGWYLDVGVLGGTPSSGFSGAATLPGLWNAQGIGSAPALERGGAASGVTIDISSAAAGGTTSGATDPARLLLDDAGDCTAPQAWSVEFDGLPDTDYLVLVYAPLDPGRSTGEVLVGPTPLAALPGDTLELDAGVSFGVVSATVTDGTLLVSGGDAAGSDCAAVAGVQLLPEPGGAAGLAAGLACVALLGAGRGRSTG